ncbi:MAG: metal-dependent transcriptional regulator [Bacteroidota bacterium]|nr:metal-dependent transcriptional regulator [Bacteroidota bacterium]
MFSTAEENYLKAIYKIAQSTGDQNVSTKNIAKELSTTPASVTDMIQRLSEKELLSYEKYYGVVLTKEGQKLAILLLRKHRLWEVFLHDKLGFTWDEVHEVAEQLEHIQSSLLIDRLDAFLGFPKFDPHGDPIPNSQGSFTYRIQMPLSEFHQKGKTVSVLGVKRHQNDFLQYLDLLDLKPGKTIKIINVVDYDKSLEIDIENGKKVTISHQIAQDILVRPLED